MEFDFVIAVTLAPDFEIQRAAEIPRHVVEEISSSSYRGHQIRISNKVMAYPGVARHRRVACLTCLTGREMMHKKYFADPHDYAKRALLYGIAKPETWVVHPMLFKSTSGGPKGGGLCIREYATFLGLLPEAVLPGNKRTRQKLVDDVEVEPYRNRNLFLDPDTGVEEGDGSTTHISVCQVSTISKRRPSRIVLVFDHAFNRGGDARQKVESKLNLFRDQELFRGAVIVREHPTVCFIWLSADRKEATEVKGRLRDNLHIPPNRIVASL